MTARREKERRPSQCSDGLAGPGVLQLLHHLGDELTRLAGSMSPGGPLSDTGEQPPYIAWHGATLLRQGFDVVPVRPRSKIPSGREWPMLAARPQLRRRELRRLSLHSVGIDTRRTPVIDVDCSHSGIIDQLRHELFEQFGPMLERLGRAPRICFPFRTDEPFGKIVSSVWLDERGEEQKLEVLAAGQQFVAYGYHPDTGLPYSWYRDGKPSGLIKIARVDLPELTRAAAMYWLRRFDEIAASRGWRLAGKRNIEAGRADRGEQLALGRLAVSDEELAAVVARITDQQEYHQWIRVGMALSHQTEASDEGLGIWKEWSSGAENYDPAACDRKWSTFSHEGRQAYVTARSLYRLAGIGPPRPAQDPDLPLSEDAVAQAFAARHDGDLRFDHDIGKWMHFNGAHWHQERTDLAFDYARLICRDLRSECDDRRTIAALSRASAAAAVERLARADRTFAVSSDIWDRDPFLLGTPGGTVDLKSGQLRPSARRDFITMATAVVPLDELVPELDMPVFWRFLLEVTSGDLDVIEYLQRYGGYCLTGDTREQCLLFVHGPGGNGKSLLQSTLAQILGDYAWSAPPEMFISSRSERHPTELASLRGKRLVIASENESGKAWAEVRIKQMTGGDRLTARLMRQDFFEFDLTAKFFFVGNNQPALTQVDNAMRRRFHVMEFAFVPATADNTLAERMRPEYPAILRWLIEGCLKWQSEGLAAPEAIRTATKEYFDEQDVVQEWLDTACEVGAHYAASNSDLRESFQRFAQSRGPHVVSDPLPRLRRRFTPFKNKYGIRERGYLGLRVLSAHEEP